MEINISISLFSINVTFGYRRVDWTSNFVDYISKQIDSDRVHFITGASSAKKSIKKSLRLETLIRTGVISSEGDDESAFFSAQIMCG